MTAENHWTDPRTDAQKQTMANHFAANESTYRDADWCSIVYEDDSVVLIADHKGYEFDEWDSEFEDETFSQTMHDLAGQLVDCNWTSDYPIVFDKIPSETTTRFKPMKETNACEGKWQCVDARPFKCPNRCGLLSVESQTSVWCEDCGYSRRVIKHVPEE